VWGVYARVCESKSWPLLFFCWISEAILIPKIYADCRKSHVIFQKFLGRPPAGARALGARFGASPPYRAPPPFIKFLDPPLMSTCRNVSVTMSVGRNLLRYLAALSTLINSTSSRVSEFVGALCGSLRPGICRLVIWLSQRCSDVCSSPIVTAWLDWSLLARPSDESECFLDSRFWRRRVAERD